MEAKGKEGPRRGALKCYAFSPLHDELSVRSNPLSAAESFPRRLRRRAWLQEQEQVNASCFKMWRTALLPSLLRFRASDDATTTRTTPCAARSLGLFEVFQGWATAAPCNACMSCPSAVAAPFVPQEKRKPPFICVDPTGLEGCVNFHSYLAQTSFFAFKRGRLKSEGRKNVHY